MKYIGLFDNQEDIVTKEKLETKQDTITGAATSITDGNLVASRALVSDANGKVAASAVTSTELGYLDGVTSNIQTQLNSKLSTAPVTSVNNKTGAVSLTASDVSAIPSTLTGTAGQVLTKTADGQEWADVTTPQPAITTPLAPTEAGSVGTSAAYARGDHTHQKELPAVSADDNAKILQVVNGAWSAADEANIAPTIGTNGNWYIGGVDSGKPSRGAMGATGATGATGAQGPQGKGLQILGYYATLDALTAAVTSPAAGDAYGVGTAEPYNIYVWDGVGSAWVDNGTAVGVEGNYLEKENPTGTGDLVLTNCKKVAFCGKTLSQELGEQSFTVSFFPNAGAFGKRSVAFFADARGDYSFAMGGSTGAGAVYGFAGPNATAEGFGAVALGAMNEATVAGQTVVGAFGKPDAETARYLNISTGSYDENMTCGKNVFIIGNGESFTKRSNAFTVDWDGNVWALGSLEGTALILKSSTAGSEKRFVVRVNDAGVLSAEDIDTLNYVMTVSMTSGNTLTAVKDLYTEEEITAISGQEGQYPVKYGHSYYVEYQYQSGSSTYDLKEFVRNVTDNITVSI